MLELLRRYRELRPVSVLVFVAALLVGGYNVHRALGFGSHVEQASLAAEKLPLSGDINLDQFGDPVLTKADVSTLKSLEKLTRIEELQVGERIRSDAPTEEFDLQFGTDIIRSEWRKVTLVAPKRDGSSAGVVLLRPLPWLTEHQADVGRTVYISVPECGIDGHANVLAIEPCPEIEPAGDLGGRVITGTFRHQVSASISLSIAGQPEPILCTGNHPFWSEDRQTFVRADSLQSNETLRTTTGTTTVTSLTHVPGSTAVYNIEIHGTHVYHVGSSGVLVHNGDPDLYALWAAREVMKSLGLEGNLLKEFKYSPFGFFGFGRGDAFHRASGTMFEGSLLNFGAIEELSDEMLQHKLAQLEKYAEALRDPDSKLKSVYILLNNPLPASGAGAEYTNLLVKLKEEGLPIAVRIIEDCR